MADNEPEEVIFISYGREEEVIKFVKQLGRDLEANGFSVWLDQESISSGSDWHGAIATGLHECTFIIPVITQKYANSRYCMNELYTADGDRKMIFPILYDDPQQIDFQGTELGRSLKFMISGINWTMCRPGVDDYGESLNKLIKGMKSKVSYRSQTSEQKPSEEKDSEAVAVITAGPPSSNPIKVISGIQYPAKIATGRNGEIVVASYMSHKVHVYNCDYELQRTIGCQGYMDGQFMCPSGITIDKRNQIYVSSMNKVDVFTMEGQFLNSFGSQGNGPLEFSNATDIAVGKKGEIYVADAQNNRVQVLNRDLSFRTSMSEGSSGHGSGCLSQPQAIAVNSEGNVYIADMMNHCVQAFTPDGTFLLSFGEYGAGNVPGALCSPMGIAVDGQDNVYVGNSTGSVCIFDKKGNFLRQFGSYGSKLGQFNVIRGMHIDKEGRLYVSEWNSNRIQIFEGSPFMKKQQEAEVEENLSSETEADVLQNTPKPAYMIGPTSNTPVRILSELKEPQGIVEGKNGELVVASTDQSKLFVYSRTDDYKLLTTIGGEGDQDGMFRRPCGVAITPDNLILVSSFNKLQWFTVEGKLVYAVGDGGKEEMEFDYPADVAVSHKDGRIYVLDKKNKRVQILTGDATYHSSFQFPQKDDTFTSLAINSEGNLYFADPSNNCVHVFSPSGEFLFKFGKTGSVMERGTLHSPNTVAIDNDDYVYVGSSIMLSIFDKTGKFIKAFGGNGSEPGEFSYITCLHISNSGHLYVSDYNNDRVQIFEINQTPCESETYNEGMKTLSMCRRPVYTIGPASDMPGKILSGGDIGEPAGVTVTENGDLLVLNKKKKQVFFFDSETYVPKDDEITQLLWESSRDCEILDPNDIAVCEDGCLLMCVRNQLVKLTMSEEVIASVGKRGRRGREDDELDTPDGIAVSRDGLIYVADKGNHRVQIFNSDLSYRGTCVNPNSSGCAEMDPERVAVNSEGAVYVTDRRHNCIYVFDASGKFLFEFGQRGHSRDRGRISSPVAIAIDQQDYVYISGSYIGVSIFDRQGVFIRSFGESGEDPGKFKDIKSMHIDRRGNLYVCESGNNRIQVFAGIQSQSQSEKDHTASQETTFCDVLPKVVAAEHTIAPLGITEGRNGEIIVISATDHKVYVFNQQRELTAEFGGRGDLDGYFNFPTSVAVTTDNLIVVSSHDKLQWFTITGQLVYATGNRGNEEMEFEHPDSITIGKDGRIYVLEKKNKRVQIFNGNATYHSSFKLKVDHPPDAIAVNSDGEIYLVDTRNSCIKIVSQKGEYISKIISAGSMSLARPTAIAIDEKDQLFVGTVSGIIAVLDKQGKFQRALRGDNDPVHISTHFNLIRDLHVSRTRHIYVSEFSHNQVQIIGPLEDNAPEIESSPPAPPSTPTLPYRPIYTYGPRSVFPVKVLDGIKEPSVIISGPNNVILIATCGDHKIYSYNPTTQFLCPQIAELVNREGSDKQLLYPSGLALSADGYLLVSSENQLLKLALDGTVVAFVGNQRKRSGTSNNELDKPKDIVVAKDGRIFLIDHGNHRIQVFDKDLQYVKTLCNPDSKERKSEYLECMAFNSAGDLYVTDSRSCKVQVYNQNGRFKFAFGKKSSSRHYSRGDLSRPHAITVNREDLVCIGDENGIVSIFSKKGKFLRSFGGSGKVPGLFGSIQAMHIDSQGSIYIGEWKNDRVQVFQGQK